ncbi:MAG: Arc family DNA-binding protein [Candidatus Aminicenantes bacterium]|nr:MAG: Arc family DNA-binding protein [Candidatus Aminicenantes bacterium]
MKPNRNHLGDQMPTNFTLKNIPEDLYKKVKERAQRNNRSINGEIISIISAAMASRHSSVDEILARARALRARTGGFLTDDFINKAKREGRP